MCFNDISILEDMHFINSAICCTIDRVVFIGTVDTQYNFEFTVIHGIQTMKRFVLLLFENTENIATF